MNDRRYRSYRLVSRRLSSDLYDAFEREVLLDAAEGLLLMRSPRSSEIASIQGRVDAVLAGMVAARRIHSTLAAELREHIGDCGPLAADVVAA